ncbi:MAG: glycosyltransferase, partial [Methylococcaceae bacterium]|nr:glycosyltransferase [Methylococcaceae bacterium]
MVSVSIIIPTFNRSALLERALESVNKQTVSDYEIIVVDDGSTDNTAEMIQTKFPEVQYVLQPNRGVSSARNKGLKLAKGQWLAFLDSDDEWLPDKLE